MKLFKSMVFVVLLCMAATANSNELSSVEKTERMKQYNAVVRAGIEMMWSGMRIPAEIGLKNDSLRYYLYEDTVSIPLSMKVISRLTVETYNIVAKTGKTDYHQIIVALNSCKNVPAFYDRFFLASSIGLGEYNLEQKSYRQAQSAFLLALRCVEHEKNIDSFKSFLPYLHLQLGQVSSLAGDYSGAVMWQKKYVDDMAAADGEGNEDYYDALDMLAIAMKRDGMIQEADSIYSELCDRLRIKGLQKTDRYVNALLTQAVMTGRCELYDELVSIVTDNSDLFSESLSNAAAYYYGVRDYDKMTVCLDKALKAVETDGSKVDLITGFFPILNAPVIKSKYSSRILNLLVKNNDSENLVSCAALATAYAKCGHFSKAVRNAAKVRKMADKQLSEGDSEAISVEIDKVVEMFVAINDFESAIYYMNQSLPHIEKIYGVIEPSIVRDCRKLLASYYSIYGDYHTALRILRQLMAEADLSADEKIAFMADMVNTSYGVGDYETVDRYCSELLALDLDSERRWEILNLKTSALISLIDTYYDRKSPEFDSRMASLKAVVDENSRFVDTVFPDDIERRVLGGINAATMNFLSDMNEEMVGIADETEKLIRKGIDNKDLRATYLGCLAMYHIKAGNYAKALKLVSDDYEDSDIGTLYNLQIKAESNLGMGKTDKAQQIYIDMANRIVDATARNFSMLTENEKGRYWRMFERQIADAGRFAVENDPRSSFGGVVYNLALYSKGLLLNSSRAFARLMENNPDSMVRELYILLKNKRRQLSDNSKIGVDERKLLSDEVSEIELMLMKRVPESRNYMTEIKYDWTDLKKRLGDNDVAIEFLEFQGHDYRRTYAAAVVTSSIQNPVILNLGRVEEVDNAVESTFKADAVWNKLMPYLSADGRNYFSAVGKLHCLPIESLLTDDGRPLSSVYPIYRLSSTRELLKDEYKCGDGMVMFGGIHYGKSGSGTSRQVHRGVAFSLPYLPGTLKEIEAVASLIEHDKLADKPQFYKGADGSESNFKRLSGKNKRILHIGTHGYYISSKSSGVSKLPYSARKLFGNNEIAENILLNNGLFMAGVNCNQNSVDSVADDGVLTALEISEMDLSGVDMVVLSACETGLGAVSSDGVFGLQRGFKLADVNSIMMSLDKVDDDATCVLMTEFYRNYLSGHSKHDAFEKAKEHVRMKFPERRQWASFIMLDAID